MSLRLILTLLCFQFVSLNRVFAADVSVQETEATYWMQVAIKVPSRDRIEMDTVSDNPEVPMSFLVSSEGLVQRGFFAEMEDGERIVIEKQFEEPAPYLDQTQLKKNRTFTESFDFLGPQEIVYPIDADQGWVFLIYQKVPKSSFDKAIQELKAPR